MANRVIKLDELTHNGVKGMKWDETKRRIGPIDSKIKGNRLKKEEGFRIGRENIGPPTLFGRNIKKLTPKTQAEVDTMTANEYVDYLNTYKIERTDETEAIWQQKRKSEKVKHSDLDLDRARDFIEHEGVLGMHWGIRRFQKKNGHRTPAGRRRDAANESEDYVKSRENRSRGTESLSNEELRKLNERLQLEAAYKTLTTVKIEKAESFVGKALKAAAGAALTDFSKGIMLGAAKSLVKEISPSLAEAAGFGVKAAVAAAVAPAAPAPAAPKPPKAPKVKNHRRVT